MQLPVLSGIYTDGQDVRISYPINLVPVPKSSGLSSGYLRQGYGITQFSVGAGPGADRGGINWYGICYRVMGSKLVRVASDGTITTLGEVGGSTQPVKMTYSFDRLAIASAGRLYYWSSTLGLITVTDPDLGTIIDIDWIDGYFVAVDSESLLVITELNDPTSVNPLKYGSSEVDPDPVKAVLKLRNEIYAINRHTIEVFDNVGGQFFPFQRVEGAQVTKGSIGTNSCCIFLDAIAFLGSGRNESPSIYIAVNSLAKKIATDEIDKIITTYKEPDLAAVKIEQVNIDGHTFLYVHLPDRTLVYDGTASSELQMPVWFTLVSCQIGMSRYRAKNHVWAYDKYLVGDTDTGNIGFIDKTVSTHWGATVRWEFSTVIIYAEGRGAIINSLELVALTGGSPLGVDARISTSYSLDGRAWSTECHKSAGTTGDTGKRLVWFQQGMLKNWRIQRFRGDTKSRAAIVRLEMSIEGLAV